MEKEYGDWRVTLDENQVAWLWFDKQNSAVNTLDPINLSMLEAIVTDLTAAQAKAMVLQSAKKSGFCAGANVALFTTANENPSDLQTMIEIGQRVFRCIEEAPFFTLAVIDGFCLGGGFELVLACKARLVVDQAKTRLGFPEVMLGVVPGWGGDVRLARQIGCWHALKMAISGKPVDAKTAVKLRIAAMAVQKRHLNAAIDALVKSPPKAPKASKIWSLFWQWSWVRLAVIQMMQHALTKKVNPAHYPAPFRILADWKKTNVLADNRAYENEVRTFIDLVTTETAQNLVRVYFLKEGLKSTPDNPEANNKAMTVHVIGAGRMGGDIAAWLALRGSTVTITDENADRIAQALKEARSLFAHKLKDAYERQAAIDRLIPDTLGAGVRKADLIIEAVVENLEVKQAVLQACESQAKATAILATNTSTIPLESLTTALQNPNRLLGLHFFNPVALMPLVEIIHGKQTDMNLIAVAISLVKQWGKLPLSVKSAPGFVVNRILTPYLMESILLLEEGFSAESIDSIVVQAGFPMGPFLLMDTVGLDVCMMVAKNLTPHATIPQTLKRLVDTGALGKKTHRGFYAYNRGNPVRSHQLSSLPSEVMDRLWVRLWNAAERVLQENIVPTDDDIDAGLLFGAGFPPFQGGLLHYIDQHKTVFEQKRTALIERYGERFSLFA